MQVFHIVPKAYATLGHQNSGLFAFVESRLLGDKEYMEQIGDGVPITTDVGPHVKPAKYKDFIKQAEDSGVAEIIAPNVTCDSAQTWQLTAEFIEAMRTAKSKLKIMIVPQGTGLPDYENCIMEMLPAQDDFHTVGFPAGTLARVGSDLTGQEHVYPNRSLVVKRAMRLLRIGMWECCILEIGNSGPLELAEMGAQFARISRLITAAAFGCAIVNRDLTSEGSDFDAPNLHFSSDYVCPEDKKSGILPLAYKNMGYLNDYARSIGAPA